ncbi:MAG: hypothetical protein AAGN35_13200 [Bacteroidota bacterium]
MTWSPWYRSEYWADRRGVPAADLAGVAVEHLVVRLLIGPTGPPAIRFAHDVARLDDVVPVDLERLPAQVQAVADPRNLLLVVFGVSDGGITGLFLVPNQRDGLRTTFSGLVLRKVIFVAVEIFVPEHFAASLELEGQQFLELPSRQLYELFQGMDLLGSIDEFILVTFFGYIHIGMQEENQPATGR